MTVWIDPLCCMNCKRKIFGHSLNELKHWNQAAFNPYELYDKGIEFAFSSYDMKADDFKKNIIKTIHYGLDRKIALSALTTIPANKLGLEEQFDS